VTWEVVLSSDALVHALVLAGHGNLNASKDVGRWWDGTQRKMLVDIVVTASEARGVCVP